MLHHPLAVIFYIELEAIHDFLGLLVALEVAAEALRGRCVTDLLSLEAARPGYADLAYNAAALTIQQGAYGRHRGLLTTAATVRLLEGIA